MFGPFDLTSLIFGSMGDRGITTRGYGTPPFNPNASGYPGAGLPNVPIPSVPPSTAAVAPKPGFGGILRDPQNLMAIAQLLAPLFGAPGGYLSQGIGQGLATQRKTALENYYLGQEQREKQFKETQTKEAASQLRISRAMDDVRALFTNRDFASPEDATSAVTSVAQAYGFTPEETERLKLIGKALYTRKPVKKGLEESYLVRRDTGSMIPISGIPGQEQYGAGELGLFGNVYQDPAMARAEAQGIREAGKQRLQQVDISLGGKPVPGVQDLNTGKVFYQGQEIKNPIVFRQPQQVVNFPGINAPIDPKLEKQVENEAMRVISGQSTSNEALSRLGGVRAGLGPILSQKVQELQDKHGAILANPKLRDKLEGLATADNIVGELDRLVNDVIASPTPVERAKRTLLLENYGQSVGSLISRGALVERGVLTDQDVKRATGLVPGWKSANLDPDFAGRELKLLHNVIEQRRKAVFSASIGMIQGPGAEPGAAPGEGRIHLERDPKTGKLKQVEKP